MSARSWVVPKATITAEVMDLRGRSRTGELYLAALDGQRENLQTLLCGRRFVPFHEADDRMTMLSPRGLLWVRLELLIALDEIDGDAEADPEARTADVELLLEDGSTLSGVVRYLRPSDRRRLSDYLESVGEFFPLRTSDHVYLVRRERVLAVTPVQERPR